MIVELHLATQQKHAPGTVAVLIFDQDDPNMPDECLDHINSDGFTVISVVLPKLAEALREMDMPDPSAGLLWNARDRVYVRPDGAVVKRYKLHYPFRELAARLEEPLEPGEFFVCTFVGGSAAVFRAVLDVRE